MPSWFGSPCMYSEYAILNQFGHQKYFFSIMKLKRYDAAILLYFSKRVSRAGVWRTLAQPQKLPITISPLVINIVWAWSWMLVVKYSFSGRLCQSPSEIRVGCLDVTRVVRSEKCAGEQSYNGRSSSSRREHLVWHPTFIFTSRLTRSSGTAGMFRVENM